MTHAHASNVVADDAAVEFVCSEIWGGNRPVDREIEAPGLRGTLFSRPCDGGSGGDVHYLSVCASGLLTRMCVADVAGHGESVSAVSREIHSLLRRFMNNTDQRKVLAALNQSLEAADAPIMTTAAAISYYPPSRELSFSYAGHPPAWYFDRAADRWDILELPPIDRRGLFNVPLSVDSKASFTRGRRRVAIGDRLLVLTDGVLEAPTPQGELFGEQRVSELLAKHRAERTEQIAEQLVSSLVEFTRDESLRHDDVTFFLIEFVPGPSGPTFWHAIRNLVMRPRGNSAALEAAGKI